MNTSLKYLSALILTSTVAPHIVAQETNRYALEEIVVTAQKRAESLQDVPIAIQALSTEMLEGANVESMADIQQIAPSVMMSRGSYLQPFIRGVGSTITGTGIYSSVAIYQDGVYVPRLNSNLGDLDAESIQILKGPQGSLYGRNATGGAILITTRSPSPGDEIQGKVEATIGDYDRKGFKASVHGGLSDTAAFSLNAVKFERDGWIENLGGVGHGEDGFAEDQVNIHGKFIWDPSESLHFKFSGSYHTEDAPSMIYEQLGVEGSPKFFSQFGIDDNLNPAQTLAASNLFAFTAPFLGPDPSLAALQGLSNDIIAATQGIQFSNKYGASYDNENNGWATGSLSGSQPNGAWSDRETTQFALDIRYNFENFDLASITGYGEQDYYGSTEVLNPDPSTADFSAFGFPGRNIGFSANDFSDFYSQELMLISSPDSEIDWIAGLYYYTEEGDDRNSLDIFGISVLSGHADWEVESKAAYGQVTYPLTDNWNITAGARYTKEEYTLTDLVDPADPFNVFRLPNTGEKNFDSSKTTWNVKVDYQAEDWLVYASVSTGFKSGGLNPQSSRSAPVDPEVITAYELGGKSEWFDNQLRLNAAVFYYDYEDVQFIVFDTTQGSNFAVNAPSAEVTGLEVELEAAVNNSLTVFGGMTALDAEMTDDVPITVAGVTNILEADGNTLPNVSDLRATAGFNYFVPGVDELKLTGTIAYSSGIWLTLSNELGSGGSGDDASYTIANLNLTYTAPGDSWYATLFVNNVTDEEYYQSGVEVSGLGQSTIMGPPRNLGATVGFNF